MLTFLFLLKKQYSPTSPAYSPSSPQYSPTSPQVCRILLSVCGCFRVRIHPSVCLLTSCFSFVLSKVLADKPSVQPIQPTVQPDFASGKPLTHKSHTRSLPSPEIVNTVAHSLLFPFLFSILPPVQITALHLHNILPPLLNIRRQAQRTAHPALSTVQRRRRYVRNIEFCLWCLLSWSTLTICSVLRYHSLSSFSKVLADKPRVQSQL